MTIPRTPLIVLGHGTVSAVGCGVDSLVAACELKQSPPAQVLPKLHGARDWDCLARLVPAEALVGAPKHPRLRRASAISRFMVVAAQEALSGKSFIPDEVGIIVVVTNACVQFTDRFYHEVLQTPTLASPMLFPETVFNAPASHLAAVLGVTGPVMTLVGESNVICEALRLATLWIEAGSVNCCLIVGAEETDALAVDGMTYYHRDLVGGEGAAALLVALEGDGPLIRAVHGPYAYTSRRQRQEQLCKLAKAASSKVDALVDRGLGIESLDRDEAEAFAALEIPLRYHPLALLGDCQGAASALQLALAAELISRGAGSCLVSMPGTCSAAFLAEIRRQ